MSALKPGADERSCHASANDFPVSRGHAWYALTLLLLLTACSLIDRAVIASLLPQLRTEWALSDSQLGALVSAVNWSMAVFALPAALLVDRWSRKGAMGLMAMIWTFATVGCGLANSFVHLLMARLFIGAGEGGFGSGGASVISNLFPDRLRATAFGLFTSAGSLGGVLGVALGGYVATRWGWRMAFFVAAVPGFLIAVLFMLTVRDSPTIALKVVDDFSGNQRTLKLSELILNLAATRSLLAVYFAGVGIIFFAISLMAWLPSYFNRTAGLPMAHAAGRSALVLLASGIGLMLGGTLVDRVKQRRRDLLLIVPGIYALIGSAAIALALSQLTGAAQFIVLLCGALFSSAGLGPLFAVSQSVVYPGLRASAVGVANTLWQLLGGMGPLVTGILSDRFGVQTALLLAVTSLATAGVILIVGSRYYVADATRINGADFFRR